MSVRERLSNDFICILMFSLYGDMVVRASIGGRKPSNSWMPSFFSVIESIFIPSILSLLYSASGELIIGATLAMDFPDSRCEMLLATLLDGPYLGEPSNLSAFFGVLS